MKISLNGKWTLSYDNKTYEVDVPSTLLKYLIDFGIVEDPYFGLNEHEVRKYLTKGMTLTRQFEVSEKMINSRNYIVFEGIDTIASIYINNKLIKEVSDFHTPYRLKIDDYINLGINELKVVFRSAYEYLDEVYDPNELFESFAQADYRFPKIRKMSSSFGWDWGPNLADMGLYKDVYIESSNVGFITEFKHTLIFNSLNEVKINITTKQEVLNRDALVRISLYDPKGFFISEQNKPIREVNNYIFLVNNPILWWPNGYGDQPLYIVKVELFGFEDYSSKSYKIGLRDLKINTEPYEFGNKFHVTINGVEIFLKGSNYIPEDQIYPNRSYDKLKRLLKVAKDSNHNTIRIWGGGMYPPDYFYDLCDELGLLIINDLMFACATYDAKDELFMKNIKEETILNLRRIRHHASLIIISGNNECEEAITSWNPKKKEEAIESYKTIFLDVLKKIVEDETDIFYISSSPTSESPYFINTNNDLRFDRHSWEVWHGSQDIEFYRTIYPKLLSEAGLQSYPSMKMIRRYANEEDLYEFSPVMLNHQKDPRNGNKKIHEYISKRYFEPKTFPDLVYLSQLSQAEAMKVLAEHLRINKGRCMGMIYWQLNDCWGVQSWSSIDYSFTPKILQYYSKKFFSPLSLAFENNSLYVLCDLLDAKKLRVIVERKSLNGDILESYTKDILPTFNVSLKVFDLDKLNKGEYYKATLFDGINLISEEYEFGVIPKLLDLKNPKLEINKINDKEIEISSLEFAYGVFLETNKDSSFSDNGFMMEKNSKKRITLSDEIDIKDISIKSLFEVKSHEKD